MTSKPRSTKTIDSKVRLVSNRLEIAVVLCSRMSSWILQNLQKRLLLYAVQQISVLSNVDLANLHVSLGSSSQFTFDDLELAVEGINIPHVVVESGTISHLDLQLTVSGGVSIKGKGIVFVLRPVVSDQKNESYAFSLTKSIQSLTSSIMQFPEATTDLRGDADAADAASSVIANSSGSISSSGEEGEANQMVGTLENMRNKLLNVALSKLTTSFEDMKVRFMLGDGSVLQVSLGSLDFQSEKNDLRKVSLQSLDICHEGSQKDRNESTKDVDGLSNSITYTQMEATSLYMSAMESLEAECRDNDGTKESNSLILKHLVTLDHIDISFEGLSSVEDLSLRDMNVHSRQLDIKLHNILSLDESVFDLLVRSFQRDWSADPQPTNLAGYKRFQKEQSMSEKLNRFLLELERVNLHLSGSRFISLKQVNYSFEGGERYDFEVSALEAKGDGMTVDTTKAPIIRGFLDEHETSIEILHALSIKLDLIILEEFTSLLRRAQELADSLGRKMPSKKHTRRLASHERKYHIASAPLDLSLRLGEYDIRLSTEAIFSDLMPTLFKTNTIEIRRVSKNEENPFLRFQDVSIITSRSRVQLNYYDEALDEALLTSKIVCKIDKVIVRESFEKLLLLVADGGKIGAMFTGVEREDEDKSKKVHMKRSVRLLQSSNIMYKHTELALFATIINSVTVEIKQLLTDKFGTLDLSISSIMSAVTDEGNMTAFCKQLSCKRVASGIEEPVIEPVKMSEANVPLVYVRKKSSGKVKVTLTNLAFTYYARWLDIFKNLNPSHSERKSGDKKAEKTIEIKLVDSSLLLRPYRLNAALALVVDHLVCSAKIPTGPIKSTLKSGSFMLIDDFSNIKPLEDRHWPSLTSLYARQGFSAVGRFETLCVRCVATKSPIALKVKCQTIVASLCADSAHTLTQICIDLKYPLTFPDDLKYNYGREQLIDTFEGIDPNFFSSSHIREDSRPYDRAEEDLIHIDDDYCDVNEPCPNDSLSDSTSQLVNVQEAYLDVVQELRTSVPGEIQRPIEINLEFEADNITIKLFDGYDWKYTRRSISRTIDQVDQQMKASNNEPNSNSQMAMTVFDSIYVSANASDTVNLQKRVNDEIQGEIKSSVYVRKANLHPSRHYKAALKLEKLRLVFNGYSVSDSNSNTSTSAEPVNEAIFTVQRFEIIDNVPTSTWKKFLTLLRHEQWPLDRPMMRLELATYRPMSCLMATELTLGVEVAPLRLHIDQDALDFLVKFAEFKDSRFELIDEYPDIAFLQKFTTNSVKLKLDYKPKKVDYSGLRSGHASELMNFFILDGSNVTLKGVALYGINGFDELNTALKSVWTPDITSRQIPGVLEGFAPIKSILALGSGVKALVGGPVNQSSNDRRVKGSLRKGCNVFVRTTTGDFVRLGAKVASGTQTVLENAEQMLGGDGSGGRMHKFNDPPLDMNSLLEEDQLVGGSNPQVKGHKPAALVIDPSAAAGDEGEPKIVSLYADQPLDIHMGLEEAYHSLEKHMHVVYDVVWKTKGELRERDASAAAAAVSVAKVAPVAIIRPLIGATEAVAKALQGISNHFDKEQIDEINDKYKSVKVKK